MIEKEYNEKGEVISIIETNEKGEVVLISETADDLTPQQAANLAKLEAEAALDKLLPPEPETPGSRALMERMQSEFEVGVAMHERDERRREAHNAARRAKRKAEREAKLKAYYKLKAKWEKDGALPKA